MNTADFHKALDKQALDKVEQAKYDVIVNLLTEIRDLLKKDVEEDTKGDKIKT